MPASTIPAIGTAFVFRPEHDGMATSNVTPDLWPDPRFQEIALEAVSHLKDHLRIRHFNSGNLLWREGDSDGMLVVLRTGRVKVYRLLPTGRAVTLFLFGPGDVFGFLPFLDGQGYPAYAQAMENVEAEVMARSTLLQVLHADPDLAVTLIALLGQRLRTAFDQIRTLSTPGARARVAAALFALVSESSPRFTPGEVQLPVTAHEFAGALGLVPETYSRALTSLVRDGILERMGPAHYRILDMAALERSSDPASD